jgi:hypothetical protein
MRSRGSVTSPARSSRPTRPGMAGASSPTTVRPWSPPTLRLFENADRITIEAWANTLSWPTRAVVCRKDGSSGHPGTAEHPVVAGSHPLGQARVVPVTARSFKASVMRIAAASQHSRRGKAASGARNDRVGPAARAGSWA